MTAKSRKFGPRVTVSLTGSDYDALSLLAEKDEVSISWVVRRAIEEYLEHHRADAEPRLPLRPLQKVERALTGARRDQ